MEEKMITKEIDELRSIQDKFIKLIEDKARKNSGGFEDTDQVIDDFDKTTLGDLRRYIYPQYRIIFIEYIEDNK